MRLSELDVQLFSQPNHLRAENLGSKVEVRKEVIPDVSLLQDELRTTLVSGSYSLQVQYTKYLCNIAMGPQ